MSDNEFKYPIYDYSTFQFDNSKNLTWRLFDMTYFPKRLDLKPFNASQVNLKELIGTYYSPELRDEYTLKVVKGTLIASHRRNEDIPLLPFQRDWFHGNGDFFGKVVPVRNRAGKVIGINVSAQRVPNMYFARVPERPRK